MDIGDARYLKRAFCRNPLPRIEGLMFDAERFGQSDQATRILRRL